jgi:hypothetical protein
MKTFFVGEAKGPLSDAVNVRRKDLVMLLKEQEGLTTDAVQQNVSH